MGSRSKHADEAGRALWFASEYQDERLTTVLQSAWLIEQADISRNKRKKVIDKLAAQLILQNYWIENFKNRGETMSHDHDTSRRTSNLLHFVDEQGNETFVWNPFWLLMERNLVKTMSFLYQLMQKEDENGEVEIQAYSFIK